MSTAQKIVKYFAIGFAAFLIVTIFSGIIFGGLSLVTAGKLFTSDPKVELVCTNGEEKCLQINLAVSKLSVKTGESLSVDTKNDKVEITENGNSLTVIERGRTIFDKGSDRDVVIYVPEGYVFDTVTISGGVGDIQMESLKTKKLDMSLGIGDTKLDSLDMEDGEISTGIGEVSVNLASPASDYQIDVSRGIGKITLNGAKVSGSSTLGSGTKKLDISGGIGSIKITTRE